MLFESGLWPAIADGSVTVAFRMWKRPTVKAGGTLRSPVGMLAIDAVDLVERAELNEADARAAGEPDLDALLARLPVEEGRRLHRIRFHRAGEDPRDALRADDDLDDRAVAEIAAALERSDSRADAGPWTRAVLEVIGAGPGVRSAELCEQVGMEQHVFKTRVRRLKSLGLTESLEVGYRLSPRGRAFLVASSG